MKIELDSKEAEAGVPMVPIQLAGPLSSAALQAGWALVSLMKLGFVLGTDEANPNVPLAQPLLRQLEQSLQNFSKVEGEISSLLVKTGPRVLVQ